MSPRWLLCTVLLLGAFRLAEAQNQVLALDGQDDYVQLPSHIFGQLEEATVEAWVKWGNWAPYSQFFAFGTDDQWQAMGVNHAAEVPVLQFFLYTDKDHVRVLPAATDLLLGQWCHLYQGLIDEVSIHNRALSVAEIERIYGASAVARWSAEGNAADNWGGNDGTRVNSVSFAPGVVGQAFSFDGQGGTSNWPLISATSALRTSPSAYGCGANNSRTPRPPSSSNASATNN